MGWAGTRDSLRTTLLAAAALCVAGCSAETADGRGGTDSGGATDVGAAVDTGIAVDTGVVDTGAPLDSGVPPDSGVMCSLTLADTTCPATYPANPTMGCGFQATRPVMCGNNRAVYLALGFGATTCCYDGGDALIGATVRSDIGDECFQETGTGPAAFIGTGCCLGWADTSCPDAGPTD